MPITITLRQLTYFVATAETLNVSKAAKTLSVSQPSVTVAIQQLEDHYQRPLFARRAGRGMRLTDFGESQLVQARHILALATRIDQPPAHPGQLTGRLRLGFFINLAPFYAPSALTGLIKGHPDLDVQIREYDFEDLLKNLRSGEIDIAVTFDIGLDKDVQRIKLHDIEPYVMLPADHPLADQPELGLADIADEQLIMMRQAESWQYTQQLMRDVGVTSGESLRPGSFELQRAMVAAGHGVGIAWTRPAGDVSYNGGQIVCRPIADPVPSQSSMLVWHDRNEDFSQMPLARKVLTDWFATREGTPMQARP